MHAHETVEQLYNALLDEKLDAIVYDDPILLAKANEDKRFRLSGPIFHRNEYAMMLPEKRCGRRRRAPVHPHSLLLLYWNCWYPSLFLLLVLVSPSIGLC